MTRGKGGGYGGSSRDPSRLRDRHEYMAALGCLVHILAVGHTGRAGQMAGICSIWGCMDKAERGRSDPVLDLCGWECGGRCAYARVYRLCGRQGLN